MFGEFLVIVIGVMVALAADSWIESGRDAERARAVTLEGSRCRRLVDILVAQQSRNR
jgi:hypothetical protein